MSKSATVAALQTFGWDWYCTGCCFSPSWSVVSVAPASASVGTLSTRPGNGQSFVPGGYSGQLAPTFLRSIFRRPLPVTAMHTVSVWELPAAKVFGTRDSAPGWKR
jgi:hypothetical protein